MNITEHAKLRMNQRGISDHFIDYAEYFLPAYYEKQSCKIMLTKKTAKAEAKRIRRFADTIEKHAGTELLIDTTGSLLITAYRK